MPDCFAGRVVSYPGPRAPLQARRPAPDFIKKDPTPSLMPWNDNANPGPWGSPPGSNDDRPEDERPPRREEPRRRLPSPPPGGPDLAGGARRRRGFNERGADGLLLPPAEWGGDRHAVRPLRPPRTARPALPPAHAHRARRTGQRHQPAEDHHRWRSGRRSAG